MSRTVFRCILLFLFLVGIWGFLGCATIDESGTGEIITAGNVSEEVGQ